MSRKTPSCRLLGSSESADGTYSSGSHSDNCHFPLNYLATCQWAKGNKVACSLVKYSQEDFPLSGDIEVTTIRSSRTGIQM